MVNRRTILVPVDFSTFSRAAIARAMVLAKGSGAEIHLLHVLHLPFIALQYDSSGPNWAELRRSEAEKLESLRCEFEKLDAPVSSSMEEGDPSSVILAAARASNIYLIVMGSHGFRGLDRLLMGSVAERTLQRSSVPVVIVRESERAAAMGVRSILFATDFSESAKRIEAMVAQTARELGAEVEILHVLFETTVLFAPYAVPSTRQFDEDLMVAANQRLNAVLERFRLFGLQAKGSVVCGFYPVEIHLRAQSVGAQIIAMGTRGHWGLRRFRLGSVVQRVLREAQASVLVSAAKPDQNTED